MLDAVEHRVSYRNGICALHRKQAVTTYTQEFGEPNSAVAHELDENTYSHMFVISLCWFKLLK